MATRIWAGRAVRLERGGLATVLTGKPVEMLLSDDAARKLALALKKLHQTYAMTGVEVQEIADALDFVLVGDPRSVQAHAKMENLKGMEPAGDDQKEV